MSFKELEIRWAKENFPTLYSLKDPNWTDFGFAIWANILFFWTAIVFGFLLAQIL